MFLDSDVLDNRHSWSPEDASQWFAEPLTFALGSNPEWNILIITGGIPVNWCSCSPLDGLDVFRVKFLSLCDTASCFPRWMLLWSHTAARSGRITAWNFGCLPCDGELTVNVAVKFWIQLWSWPSPPELTQCYVPSLNILTRSVWEFSSKGKLDQHGRRLIFQTQILWVLLLER